VQQYQEEQWLRGKLLGATTSNTVFHLKKTMRKIHRAIPRQSKLLTGRGRGACKLGLNILPQKVDRRSGVPIFRLRFRKISNFDGPCKV
jgi:hypothetical protein